MLVLALMGHILNKIFKMKYKTHAYGIVHRLFFLEKISFDFKLNVKMKFTLEIRIFCKRNLALMDHHSAVLKLST